MSNNGVSNEVSKVRQCFVDGTAKSIRYNNIADEDFPLKGFRGFHKRPVVVLSRLNITPYLNHACHYYNNQKQCVDIYSHCERLVQLCVVRLARNDLEKLKNTYKLKSSQLNDSESSDSDTDIDVNMASKCKICEKFYSTEKKLLKHQSKKHMIVYENKPQKRVSFSDHVIVHELKQYHKCRKCTKIFENYKSLKLHMKQQHKKRKCYICHYCEKTFIDRMFFKVHIKLHCDICGQLFHRRVDYIEHRRVCRIFNLHKCGSCQRSFFRLIDLKDHQYDHLTVFLVCDICKDQFMTKCALAHHISYLHSKTRPNVMYSMRNLGTERLYLCNFCDESSVERKLIEQHCQSLPDLTNRAMTGYKDYYFCDQCMMKFDTETDMLQHKWTHFLKTNDNTQTQLKLNIDNNIHPSTSPHRVEDMLHKAMNPIIVIEKLKDNVDESVNLINLKSKYTHEIKQKDLRNSKSETGILKYQCFHCKQLYCSRPNLRRHVNTKHRDFKNLQCKVCEEIFAWPSLLKTHKCILLNTEELPFDDARPEIHFDAIHHINNNGVDDFNIMESDEYLNTVDFEIPAPIVELTEGVGVINSYYNGQSSQWDKTFICPPLQSLCNKYKLVVQEVPIEF